MLELQCIESLVLESDDRFQYVIALSFSEIQCTESLV